jgi:uncharacterized protein (DUF362 family)
MRESFEARGVRLVLDRVHSQEDYFDFMYDIRLKPPYVVKPNWIYDDYGHFTDPKILEWMLKFLHGLGKVTLVESYSFRNTSATANLKLGLKLTDYERERVRKSEADFLNKTGITAVIDELGVEYVNIAEEVLDGQTVDKEVLRRIVEAKYHPVLRDELYSFMPTKLYTLRGGTFISLAKFKLFFSMCTKNMFGLIPEHVGYGSRVSTYHGKASKDLSQNIVDINKVYRSVFNVVGLVEGVNSLSYNIGEKTGKYKSVFGYNYDVAENSGLVYYCDDSLWLDAFVHQQCGRDPVENEHLQYASSVFGEWPSELIKNAKKRDNPLVKEDGFAS